MSTKLRMISRKWTRLPASTCSSFIHLAIRNGGLGIPNLRWTIPEMARSRMCRLQKCPIWFIQHLVKSNWYANELYRWDALCPIDGAEKWHLNDVSKANSAHMTFPVGGTRFANQHLSGGGYVEGQKFYRFVQLRSTVENKNTQRVRPPLPCLKCNSGEMATLQHILCKCADNAVSIRKRHDQVLKEIVYHCQRANMVTLVEPTLPCGLKPDLVVQLPSGEVLCLDVTVVFELNKESLNQANRLKQEKYQPHLEEIKDVLRRRSQRRLFELASTQQINASTYGLAFGCRGTISATALNVLQSRLKMPRWRINKLINLVITNSLDLFVHSPFATTLM